MRAGGIRSYANFSACRPRFQSLVEDARLGSARSWCPNIVLRHVHRILPILRTLGCSYGRSSMLCCLNARNFPWNPSALQPTGEFHQADLTAVLCRHGCGLPPTLLERSSQFTLRIGSYTPSISSNNTTEMHLSRVRPGFASVTLRERFSRLPKV